MLMELVTSDSQNLMEPQQTSAEPASARIHDKHRDTGLGSWQSAEQVQNALDTVKRSAALAGAHLKNSDIRVGKGVISVDDRFRRK